MIDTAALDAAVRRFPGALMACGIDARGWLVYNADTLPVFVPLIIDEYHRIRAKERG